MKKLIGMTDFVLENNGIHDIVKYANFLKQPLEKWMFVACDEKGNPFGRYIELGKGLLQKYDEAKERVIFEGFVKCNRNSNVNCVYSEDLDLHLDTDFKFAKTIEDLVKYNLTLRK